MPKVTVDVVEIGYETFGHHDDPAVLLIMGLAMPMTGWDAAFCRMLAARGYFVVRYDHRDIGLSSTFPSDVVLDPRALLGGAKGATVYTLDDLADDAMGLLDALDIEQAHVVGASMGGMVAQLASLRHRGRVLSLVSIMSSTGAPGVGRAKAQVLPVLLSDLAGVTVNRTRAAAVDGIVKLQQTLGSPGFPLSERQVRVAAERSYDRSPPTSGEAVKRQLAAVLAASDRTDELRSLTIPTLVIHGAEDPLVDVSGGVATATAIPGAELFVVEGMGHDLPGKLWPEFTALIDANCRKAASKDS